MSRESTGPRDHFSNQDASADVYEVLAQARRERRSGVLATVVEVTGSAPQVPGAKMLVTDDGRIVGTVGGGAFERRILEEARSLLGEGRSASRLFTLNLTRDLGMCCGGEMRVFLERVLGPERLVVFGAGHIGQALCETAARAGFAVTVVDEREDWARPERFPRAARVVCEEPEVALPELVLDAATSCVVVTHDHPLDQALVKALCLSPARFVGLVGSRTKRNKFFMRLRAQGVPDEALARIRTPLGLDLGAITPEEIAVSIVAELIAVRRGVLAAAPLPEEARSRGSLAPARRIEEGES